MSNVKLTSADIIRRIEEGNQGKCKVCTDSELTVGGKVTVCCTVCGAKRTFDVNTVLYRKFNCTNCRAKASDQRKLEKFNRLRGQYLEIAESSGLIRPWTEKTMVRCKTCGYVWSLPANAILDPSKGQKYGGCPACINKSYAKTHDEFVCELSAVLPNVSVLDKYVNNYTKIRVRNNQCGHEWMATPLSLLGGHDCQRCKRHNHFVEILKQRRPNTVLLSEYTDSRLYVRVKCLVCGYEWEALASALLDYPSECCSNCAEKSLGERRVAETLELHNIEFIPQYKFDDCCITRPLPFDFYLPSYNLCIEYDGEQHFFAREFFGGENAYQRQLRSDAVKNEYCRSNGIKLLRIPYTKFNSIEDIILEYINSECCYTSA